MQYANHKWLGLMYIVLGLIAGAQGTLLSIIMRLELYHSGTRTIAIENLNYYNTAITLHGLLMIFFLVMPSLYGGIGNFLLPIVNGAPEVVFPRINSISLFMLPLAYILLLLSTISEFGGATGWTLYPPLSTSLMALSPTSVDLIIIGLAVSGISSLLTSINFIATLSHQRAIGLISSGAPFLSWALLFTAFLLLLTLPVLTGGLVMILTDLHFNTQFYDPSYGGDPVLYQHLFWFFGHPEVYILILPAFAVISQILGTVYNKQIFGNQAMILAMGCISILGSIVWAHHMFTVGMEADTRAFFNAATILIALPTGTKIFNWLGTYMTSNFAVTQVSQLGAIAFVILFVLGGTTGVILGHGAVDVSLHDTYYVVAHFHFVLSLGALLAIATAFLFWLPDFIGIVPNTLTSTMFLVSWLLGVLLTFVPQHLLGFSVMPRRIPDYSDALNYINVISTLGSTV
eukprot:GHVT01048480.1.p1 GENE.GHVT01048480.1~~GHVT01048480.1.p1  ORF type:complete len:459 (+),score=-77.74 GHVT01048480.1:438-1814(+)